MNYRVVTVGEDIYHHGIKGQRWGVRRFQNSDGSLTAAGKQRYSYRIQNGGFVIEKGSELHRVTTAKKERNRGFAYASFTPDDVQHYATMVTGWMNHELKAGEKAGKVKTFDMTMKATKDLVAPSEREKINTFISLYENKRIVRKNVSDEFSKFVNNAKSGDAYAKYRANMLKDAVMKIGVPESTAELYALFSIGLSQNQTLRKEFFKELKKSGYNVILDTEDAIKESQAPLIVFNRKNSLKVMRTELLPLIDSDEWWDNIEKQWANEDIAKTVDKTIPSEFRVDWQFEKRLKRSDKSG